MAEREAQREKREEEVAGPQAVAGGGAVGGRCAFGVVW